MRKAKRTRDTGGVLTNGCREVNRVPVSGPLTFRNLQLRLGGVLTLLLCASGLLAQDEPQLTVDVVSFEKLLPLLPEPPAGWSSEKPEGSTTDTGSAKITTVHRDYKQGEAENAPTTSISIIDSAANPEFVSATTATWSTTQNTAEGYAKSFKLDEQPGFETYERDNKHGSLWLLVAKRYLLQIDTNGQASTALQEWLKRVDLKKLADVK
jgi:hypothetical protein